MVELLSGAPFSKRLGEIISRAQGFQQMPEFGMASVKLFGDRLFEPMFAAGYLIVVVTTSLMATF